MINEVFNRDDVDFSELLRGNIRRRERDREKNALASESYFYFYRQPLSKCDLRERLAIIKRDVE